MPQPPSLGAVTSPYGMRTNPNDGKYRMHYGEDTVGRGNYAPATGTVVYADFDLTGTGLGWAVGIREDANPAVIWWVGHHGTSVKVNPLSVRIGDRTTVRATYLGPSGTTGAAKGQHAHTERRVGGAPRPGSGTPTDPRDYYGSGGGSGGVTPLNQGDEDMVVLYCKDTTGNLWTIVDHANRVFDQTRDQDEGNGWASTVNGGSTTVQIPYIGKLTGAYRKAEWPFPHADLAPSSQPVGVTSYNITLSGEAKPA